MWTWFVQGLPCGTVHECICAVTHPEPRQSLKTGFLDPAGIPTLPPEAAPSPIAELLKTSTSLKLPGCIHPASGPRTCLLPLPQDGPAEI